MVVDLKYSKEHGVKICELQHGILSTFHADVFMHSGHGIICPKVERAFAEVPIKKWAVGSHIAFRHLREVLQESSSWKVFETIQALTEDPEFAERAKIAPEDPSSIASYYGILYINPEKFPGYEEFCKKYPGILILDRQTFACWKDKYKMGLLFNKSPLVAKSKPEWGIYPKVYSRTLTQQIISDIPADTYVIKPRGAFLGYGVIIVSQNDLEATLRYIITGQNLCDDPDHSYSYWGSDPYETFLVEKYYPSDSISFDNKSFEPTMRAAVILSYDKGTITCNFLGGYWMLPLTPLDEEGTLNARKKAYCKIPYFVQTSQQELDPIEKELQDVLPLLYLELLE